MVFTLLFCPHVQCTHRPTIVGAVLSSEAQGALRRLDVTCHYFVGHRLARV